MRQMLVAAEEAGGLAVVLPPLYEIFWSALVLLVVLLVVGRYALPRLYDTMDRRQAAIQEGLDAAARAKADQAAAARERDEILRVAQAEAAEIRRQAAEDAKGIVAAARTEAQAEAARVLDNAQRQILAEKQAAEITLRSDVGLLATELAEKIVGEHLADAGLTARVVDRFLDDLESQPVPGGAQR
ncbi:F0F1 ATP synthase subunit B [Actinomyces sp. B33]|uniref:F0F1 ATP synthase subunit B n=1 Tax=Actinomyces sp. B33 TaxID=2942131 RepID=UPI00233F81B3|nr:F0F1 ATP synthase subunit B [Actinomyces sp. B33]MDC4232855.1 F0F1 ATP synthase subunit B [Actinomyces sp. B33]